MTQEIKDRSMKPLVFRHAQHVDGRQEWNQDHGQAGKRQAEALVNLNDPKNIKRETPLSVEPSSQGGTSKRHLTLSRELRTNNYLP